MPSSAVRESTENRSLPNDTHRAIPSAPPMSPSTDKNYEREDVNIRNHDNNSEFILEPLLAYILFSLQSSTSENISKAVLGHFTPEQIFNAKEVLWGKCDVKVIGQKVRRRGSNVRSEQDANLQDIIAALMKLDKVDKLPCVVIDAGSLGIIPRSHPEELNNISLLDRLNRLEARVTSLQQGVDTSLRLHADDVERPAGATKLYSEVTAAAVSKQTPVKLNDSSITNNKTIKDNGVRQQIQQKTQQVQQQSSQPHQGQQPIPQISQQEENASQQQCQQQQQDTNAIHFRSEPEQRINRPPQRQPLRGRGRGRGSTNLRGLGRLNHPPRGPVDDRYSSNMSLGRDSWRSSTQALPVYEDGDGFQYQRQTMRNIRQKENKRRRVITGTARGQERRAQGAPEPSRHLFIYRVSTTTLTSDLSQDVSEMGFTVRDLQCLSHDNAMFKSFKLTVPKSEFADLFDGNIWPQGIRVRKFIPPRSGSNEQSI